LSRLKTAFRQPDAAKRRQTGAGFTLVELLVVISVVAVMFISFGTFFTNYLILYSKYQQDASSFTELANQSQRIADVLRGVTDIISESSNSLSAYAYFSPQDNYVSVVHYYLNAKGTAIMVDVTPMSANPPIGTPLTNSTKTYTIISNYYQASGVNLFNYYDASGTLMTLPIADEHSILEIQVNLAEPGSHTKNGQTLSITTSLRNRKTNL